MKNITIKGELEELVECEFHLIMLGYNGGSEEEWNNNTIRKGYKIDRVIAAFDNNCVEYHYHPHSEFDMTAEQFLKSKYLKY